MIDSSLCTSEGPDPVYRRRDFASRKSLAGCPRQFSSVSSFSVQGIL